MSLIKRPPEHFRLFQQKQLLLAMLNKVADPLLFLGHAALTFFFGYVATSFAAIAMPHRTDPNALSALAVAFVCFAIFTYSGAITAKAATNIAKM